MRRATPACLARHMHPLIALTQQEKIAAAFGGYKFAAHPGDAAEKMPMPGRCGHLLFPVGPLNSFRRRFHLCLIDTADGLAHIAIVAGTRASLVHNILLKFLQFRE
jgi:hypothetical protein